MPAQFSSDGKTTLPTANSTFEAAGAAKQLFVHWVSPENEPSFLRVGHAFGREGGDTTLKPRSVSRRHAEVVAVEGGLGLSDLDSANGSFVNRVRVTKQTLRPGDVVRLGDAVGLVRTLSGSVEPYELKAIRPDWYGGPTLCAALADAMRFAPQGVTIVVQGESGTGKEGTARAIHAWSRRTGQFVPVDCATLDGELVNARLFGYRKGAFTDASRDHDGAIVASDGGTLFLDEILNLPLPVQSKLLRVLQEHEVVRLGDSRPTKVRLHVVAAAQGSIEEAVNNGRFRFDLWQRLNGMTVELPPLRERKEDIIPLFVRLLQQGRTTTPPSLEPKLIEALLLYRWPGNLRELASFAQDVGRRHVDVGTLSKAVLRPQMIDPPQPPDAVVSDTPVKEPVRRSTTDDTMRQAIVEMLKQTGDNKSQAARNLQISLAHLNRVLANMDK
ncbi:MAG: hypothetical protein RLZZ450_2807 [Pseudomonadota bacterium]|jgi:transcriptional regulator of acetoin/glycerol metabolism